MHKALMAFADKIVGWYTQDWVVRERSCKGCGWRVRTVEVIEQDLREIYRHVRDGIGPHGGRNDGNSNKGK